MNSELIALTFKGIRRRLKSILRSMVLIALAFTFVTGILLLQENMSNWQNAYNKKHFGDWFVMCRSKQHEETKVLKMFLKIAREKTAIIVSHRIGICKEVDKIIVMKEGKIAEIGNHEKLLAEKGEYYRLYTMQQKWYEE